MIRDEDYLGQKIFCNTLHSELNGTLQVMLYLICYARGIYPKVENYKRSGYARVDLS